MSPACYSDGQLPKLASNSDSRDLAVCYAFFYIDKTTLSYAAIFGIRDDLHLHGTQYNWLSSIFYFGFLAWLVSHLR